MEKAQTQIEIWKNIYCRSPTLFGHAGYGARGLALYALRFVAVLLLFEVRPLLPPYSPLEDSQLPILLTNGLHAIIDVRRKCFVLENKRA